MSIAHLDVVVVVFVVGAGKINLAGKVKPATISFAFLLHSFCIPFA